MIEVQGLRKQFGELVAVDDVTFTAEAGRIFGLLGPNGAGKSTTIHCISGLLQPSAGTIRVLGHDVVKEALDSRRSLGIVPQDVALYEEVSARENLDYWGRAYGLRGADLTARIDQVLERTGLADRAREPVKRFSGGMKRRLNFACGVVHAPRVVLLDEPTVGVDAQSRVSILDLVRELAHDGACVLYTTHYMEEAEQLCDALAIVDHGVVIARGTVDDLRRQLGDRDIVTVQGTFDPDAVRRALAAVDGLQIVQVDTVTCRLAMPEAPRHLSTLIGALAGAGADIRETTLTRSSLENLFIELTGRELRE